MQCFEVAKTHRQPLQVWPISGFPRPASIIGQQHQTTTYRMLGPGLFMPCSNWCCWCWGRARAASTRATYSSAVHISCRWAWRFDEDMNSPLVVFAVAGAAGAGAGRGRRGRGRPCGTRGAACDGAPPAGSPGANRPRLATGQGRRQEARLRGAGVPGGRCSPPLRCLPVGSEREPVGLSAVVEALGNKESWLGSRALHRQKAQQACSKSWDKPPC